jgi:hypothetical protein
MKIVTMILFAATLLAAQDRPTPTAAARKSASADASPSVPAGAIQVEPNLYRFTDAQGKTWLARRTPFGFSKWEDKPVPQPVIEDTNPALATDLGDSVRFERKNPFGVSRWVRKKTELTESERAWLARSLATGQTEKP